MTEPMLFIEWCQLCSLSHNSEPDEDNGECFICLWKTIKANHVRVRKPSHFLEEEIEP